MIHRLGHGHLKTFTDRNDYKPNKQKTTLLWRRLLRFVLQLEEPNAEDEYGQQ
jgi:hypothetical protein